jgi:hypothetical protein
MLKRGVNHPRAREPRRWNLRSMRLSVQRSLERARETDRRKTRKRLRMKLEPRDVASSGVCIPFDTVQHRLPRIVARQTRPSRGQGTDNTGTPQSAGCCTLQSVGCDVMMSPWKIPQNNRSEYSSTRFESNEMGGPALHTSPTLTMKSWYGAIALLLCLTIPAAPANTLLKEYSYESDGFAIKFPYAPEPHLDRIHPDFKVWTIRLTQRASVSIRVIVDNRPCDVALGQLKNMATSQNVPIREFSISGRPAWEEKEHLRAGGNMVLERYVCGVGRYYLLTLGWPVSESRPELGVEIMNSFRLLK